MDKKTLVAMFGVPYSGRHGSFRVEDKPGGLESPASPETGWKSRMFLTPEGKGKGGENHHLTKLSKTWGPHIEQSFVFDAIEDERTFFEESFSSLPCSPVRRRKAIGRVASSFKEARTNIRANLKEVEKEKKKKVEQKLNVGKSLPMINTEVHSLSSADRNASCGWVSRPGSAVSSTSPIKMVNGSADSGYSVNLTKDTSIQRALVPCLEICESELDKSMYYTAELEKQLENSKKQTKFLEERVAEVVDDCEDRFHTVEKTDIVNDLLRRKLTERTREMTKMRLHFTKELSECRSVLSKYNISSDDMKRLYDPNMRLNDEDTDELMNELDPNDARIQMLQAKMNEEISYMLQQAQEKDRELERLRARNKALETEVNALGIQIVELDNSDNDDSIGGSSIAGSKSKRRKSKKSGKFSEKEVGCMTDLTFNCMLKTTMSLPSNEIMGRIYVEDLLTENKTRAEKEKQKHKLAELVVKNDLLLKQVYRHYTVIGCSSVDKADSGMGVAQLYSLIKDARLNISGNTQENFGIPQISNTVVDSVWKKAIMDRSGDKEASKSRKPGSGLQRFEFIESLIRVAALAPGDDLAEKFNNMLGLGVKRLEADTPDRIPRILMEQMEQVKGVLKEHNAAIRKAYAFYSRSHADTVDTADKADTMDATEMVSLFKDAGVLDSNLTVQKLMTVFIACHKEDVDSRLIREDSIGLDMDIGYKEFQEAICRAAFIKYPNKDWEFEDKVSKLLTDYLLKNLVVGWVPPVSKKKKKGVGPSTKMGGRSEKSDELEEKTSDMPPPLSNGED